MKKLELILKIIFIFFVSNCEKEKLDYREKYVGNWEFNVTRNEYYIGTIGDGYNKTDTIIYFGKIEYGNSKNEIKATYTKDDVIIFNLNDAGVLSYFVESYGGGKFENNNQISFYYRYGGGGGGGIHRVRGKKI